VDELARTPTTPSDAQFGGSLRSILKDRNTPATGQNVRFFSRDAFKTISPDASADTSAASQNEADNQVPFMARLTSGKARGALARDLFAPPPGPKSHSSPPVSPTDSTHMHGSMTPLPPPEISNIFDLSTQRELPPIPGNGTGLLDDAIEIFEGDSSRDSGYSHASHASSAPARLTSLGNDSSNIFHSAASEKEKPAHDRSHSFSFGQTVFRAKPSMPTKASDDISRLSASALGDAYPGRPPSRNRAMSDSAFQTLLRAATPSRSPAEYDIHDVSNASIMYTSTPAEREKPTMVKREEKPPPDPFSATATTYYTPGTMLPPTPPQPMHARKASHEENELWRLRTQLALQADLVAQYEVDLRARDALVSNLEAQRVCVGNRPQCMIIRMNLMESSFFVIQDQLEKDDAKRRNVARAWKKKVIELEKIARGLEDELDRSREESFERSVMDEASDAALRQLHARKAELERSVGDMRSALQRAEADAERSRRELDSVRGEINKREEGERRLREGILAAQEEMQLMRASAGEELLEVASRRQSRAVAEWEEERERIREEARATQQLLQIQLDEVRAILAHRDHEIDEARTALEHRDEELEALKVEREALAAHHHDLSTRHDDLTAHDDDLGATHAELESTKSELASVQAELETLRAELEAQWRGTESNSDQLAEARRERDTLQAELVELENRVEGMENDFGDVENQRARTAQELEELTVAFEEEKEQVGFLFLLTVISKNAYDIPQLEHQLREEQENADNLTHALQEREADAQEFEQELKFAQDNVARLEAKVRQRDSDVEDLAKRIVANEDVMDDLRNELSDVRREYERVAGEQRRTIAELSERDGSGRTQVAEAVAARAEAEIAKTMLEERVNVLEADVERLRKTVHTLQKESSNKDLEIVNIMKEREAAIEDARGLNIALDAKQQELELVRLCFIVFVHYLR
jgi:predicted  nucleic acid-binding Zn-ribbon protein/outer membrane murein-binding lipoprotein Lpp